VRHRGGSRLATTVGCPTAGRPISPGANRGPLAGRPARQDRDLVAQQADRDVFRPVWPGEQHEPAEDAAQDEVYESNATTIDHARRTVSCACHPGQNAPKALVGGHDIVLRTHR
jgi:hypothetical protein